MPSSGQYPNLEQGRLNADPLWTAFVQGYGHQDSVMQNLFPTATVESRQGRMLLFGRDSFRIRENERAPGGPIGRVSYGYSDQTYGLGQVAEGVVYPIELLEEATQELDLDLQASAIMQHMEAQSLKEEYTLARLALDQSAYATTHLVNVLSADRWDAAANQGNPVKMFDTWKRVVKDAIGKEPNTIIMGDRVFQAFKHNDHVREQLKYTSAESVTLGLMGSMLSQSSGRPTSVHVASRLYDDANGVRVPVFTTNAMVLAYVDPGIPQPAAPAAPPAVMGQAITSPRGASLGGSRVYDRRMASYGYNYVLRGYPIIEGWFYQKSHRSWVANYIKEYRPHHTFLENGKQVAGMLILDVCSAS